MRCIAVFSLVLVACSGGNSGSVHVDSGVDEGGKLADSGRDAAELVTDSGLVDASGFDGGGLVTDSGLVDGGGLVDAGLDADGGLVTDSGLVDGGGLVDAGLDAGGGLVDGGDAGWGTQSEINSEVICMDHPAFKQPCNWPVCNRIESGPYRYCTLDQIPATYGCNPGMPYKLVCFCHCVPG